MRKIIIKQAAYHGGDTKLFHAYSPALQENRRDEPLGISASTTSNRLFGVQRCAAKAFQKFVEPKTHLIVLENRMRLTMISDALGIWIAELPVES